MFIKVKVHPSSKKEEILKKKEDSFEIFVKEKAKEGKANQKLFELLAEYFKIPISKIYLIRGAKARNKIFELKQQ